MATAATVNFDVELSLKGPRLENYDRNLQLRLLNNWGEPAVGLWSETRQCPSADRADRRTASLAGYR